MTITFGDKTLSTETTRPDALDILREFVEDCERAYAEDYREAAGESPSPADPQQVADRIRKTRLSDSRRAYLEALLPRRPTSCPAGQRGEVAASSGTPDGARVMPTGTLRARRSDPAASS